MSVLKINLQKNLPTFILKAELQIPAHKRASLVAPSGSGKTTLFRLISGLMQPDFGSTVHLNEKEISALKPHLRNIGYVFQESLLFPALNVLENCAFGLMVRKHSKKEAQAEAYAFLEKLHLEHLALRSIETLSGGEKHRIAFVRAFIWKPDLILLDEPFTSIDENAKKELKEIILNLHQNHPVPFLMITHDPQEARELTELHFTIQSFTCQNIEERKVILLKNH